MKSTEELKKVLIKELNKSLKVIQSTEKGSNPYCNEIFDNTTYILAGIAHKLLDEYYNWGNQFRKWMDDALISDFNLDESKLFIKGVMIWGEGRSTEQWVEPFYFNIALRKNKVSMTVNIKEYNLFFGDANNPAIPYGYFSGKREYWEQQERNWAYQFNSK